MNDSFYIGAYWGGRAETLTEVVTKIVKTLERLGRIDEQFSGWYELGMSRKKALENEVHIDADNIRRLCLQKVKRKELDEVGYSKTGFLFSLWTGHKDEESSSISLNVGATFKSDKLKNSCVIKIPYEGEARERILKPDIAKKIITTLVELWNPEYAVLTSHKLYDNLNVGNKVGWITYGKTIKNVPKIGGSFVYEKNEHGHLFCIKNDEDYNLGLLSDLLAFAEVF